jgi:hypothetical protein
MSDQSLRIAFPGRVLRQILDLIAGIGADAQFNPQVLRGANIEPTRRNGVNRACIRMKTRNQISDIQ